ncbi:MAG: hypothetical protein R3D51_17800 [Hyphomicrobiaceae bacterium]
MGHSGDGNPEYIAERTAVAAVAGGTASVLSGGKFANGAITGAFAQLYNAEGGGKALKYAMAAGEFGASFVPGVGEAQDLYVLGHPNSSILERTFAGISLVANVLTGGLLPNAGGAIRGLGHLCSFEGDTRVETKRGRIAIKDIKPGDEVLARDDKTGQMAFKMVRHRGDADASYHVEPPLLCVRGGNPRAAARRQRWCGGGRNHIDRPLGRGGGVGGGRAADQFGQRLLRGRLGYS